MIIGYARVSTSEQNLDLQTKALKEAGCDKIFSDKASGKNMDRPEWEKCQNYLSTGDTLVIWKLDRLSRSMLHLVTTVQSLDERGVGFKVLTAPIDTTTAQGKLVFGIFAALAEFERSLIRERVTAGIKAAKARGVQLGRPVKATPEILAQAEELMALGKTAREAAKQVGISKTTLYRSL